jgi:predicted transposase YbfD/YdcC
MIHLHEYLCIVTIDAMGCQREIVKKIIEKDADYVIAVKKNQPTLYGQVEQVFKQAIRNPGEGLKMSSFNSKMRIIRLSF